MSGAALAHASTDCEPGSSLSESASANSVFPWGEWETTEESERTRNRRAAGRVEPIAILYPLARLSAERALARPLVVVVEAEGDAVVMSNPSLRVWGVGSDVYEALSDFGSSLTGVYDSYRAMPQNELTQDSIEYLQLLRSYLER